MPVITLMLDDADYQRLFAQFSASVSAPHDAGAADIQTQFAGWLTSQLLLAPQEKNAELSDVRVFSVLEKLVTSLHQHNFAMAHLGKTGSDNSIALNSLTRALVKDAHLPTLYVKRIQELFSHYLKTAKEVADSAHVSITNRAYGAITEAYRQVMDRTKQSLPGLDSDRAIGRAEGAAAVLVALDVMDRTTARQKTEVFKMQMPTQPKSTWVEKVFRSPRGKE